MLDKVLVKHLDKMDEINAEIDVAVDALLAKVNIDEVIADPAGAMQELTSLFAEKMIADIIPRSIEQGKELASSIEKLRKGEKIEIPDSDDPKLNEDLSNDNGRD